MGPSSFEVVLGGLAGPVELDGLVVRPLAEPVGREGSNAAHEGPTELVANGLLHDDGGLSALITSGIHSLPFKDGTSHYSGCKIRDYV